MPKCEGCKTAVDTVDYGICGSCGHMSYKKKYSAFRPREGERDSLASWSVKLY